MPFPPLVRLLPGLLASLLVCSIARAQIREEKPGPGLAEGILLDAETKDFARRNNPLPHLEGPGDKDFSIVIEAGITDLADTALFWDFDGGDGWFVNFKADGSVEFVGKKIDEKCRITTPAHVVKPLQKQTIVVSVKRNARQAESGISIDGIEVASGIVPPVDCGGTSLHSDVAKLSSLHVRVYNRALTRTKILDLAPHPVASKPAHPRPPPDGPKFIPQPGETIALLGGTEAVALAESGELEARLLLAFPQTRFHFRSLAWEGDTVFRQDRPMNFGSLEQQLQRINAGSVFLMFGRQECLDSALDQPKTLAEFKSAAETLLAIVQKVTPNIVVIAPEFFEPIGPRAQAMLQINDHLHHFIDALSDVSSHHNALFVDSRSIITDPPKPLTQDGVTYNAFGLAFWADSLAMGLKLSAPAPTPQLIHSVKAKSRLWHDYWRPSNWAFLHGDRTNQPSSRDPVNPQIRFFPAEQEKYLPLIHDAENKVFQLVQDAQKKLP